MKVLIQSNQSERVIRNEMADFNFPTTAIVMSSDGLEAEKFALAKRLPVRKHTGPTRKKHTNMELDADALCLIWDGRDRNLARLKSLFEASNKPIFEVLWPL